MNILEKISDCIVQMEEEGIEEYIDRAINQEGIDIKEVYVSGLNNGMVRAINKYEEKKIDLPEVIVCAEVLNKGLQVIDKYGSIDDEDRIKVVLAVVHGDTHEIGKNIVKIMFEAAGFEVIDMGVNRTVEDIVETANSKKADIIGLSSMMTTTRGEMKKVIDKLNSMDLENRPKVLIGGGSITSKYAEEIGADGYAPNAPNSIDLVKKTVEG